MQWILFVLILMGQASFFTCRHYKYHFVKQKKNWTEAQTYCRDKYTDLAKVLDMTDMERLCDSAQNQDEAWIGLNSPRSESGKHFRVWQWSLPGLEYHEDKKNWRENEPNDKDKPENCVTLRNSKWLDFKCNHEHFFICFDETKKSNNKFHLMKIKKTWLQAQNYCRKNHTDLVSGHQQLEEVKSELKGELETETDWWIGLFRDSWRWSDGSNVSFRFWDPQNYGPLLSDNSDNRCAMTMGQKRGKWGTDKCVTKKHFICYEDKVILIRENKAWEDALEYCREEHSQLVSINSRNEQLWVQERVKTASSPFVWLGLRYTCTLDFWFWVSNEVVRYKNWDSDKETDDCDMSGAMDRGGQHKWFRKFDNETFNFMCYK